MCMPWSATCPDKPTKTTAENNLGSCQRHRCASHQHRSSSARGRALHAAIRKSRPAGESGFVNVNSQNTMARMATSSLRARRFTPAKGDRTGHARNGRTQLSANKALLKEKANGTVLTYPTELTADQRTETRPRPRSSAALRPGARPATWSYGCRSRDSVRRRYIYTEPAGGGCRSAHRQTGCRLRQLVALNPKTIAPATVGQRHRSARAKRAITDPLPGSRPNAYWMPGSLQDAVEKWTSRASVRW